MAPKSRGISVWWRRGTQLVFLALFLALFRRTEYTEGQLNGAVNLFFRADPLVAAAASLASRTLIGLVWPALIVVGLTLIFGRFFCGWVCPLGTLLDGANAVIPPLQSGPAKSRLRPARYLLLILILTAALFGAPLVGYFDPFSLLTRGLALAWDPALYAFVTAPLDWVFVNAPTWASNLTEPFNVFFKAHLLADKQSVFDLALLTGFILTGIFALERLERRYWCRNLCPLGGMLGLMSRVSLLRWQPGVACRDCRDCRDVCRMGAIGDDGRIEPDSCTLCLDCVGGCKRSLIDFQFHRPKPKPAAIGVPRRVALGTFVAGLALPSLLKSRALTRRPDIFLIRPPGARPEATFLSRCVRCGECMKVCPDNALQPAWHEAGLEGAWTPVLKPRLGYCEFNCKFCGEVCPTGAIERLALPDKQKLKIGRAFFDVNRCLPYARGIPCLVCEEHCPVSDKAIKLRLVKVFAPDGKLVTLKQPYLVPDKCIGCGICEYKCPLPGEAGVRITSEGEDRNPDAAPDFDPNAESFSEGSEGGAPSAGSPEGGSPEGGHSPEGGAPAGGAEGGGSSYPENSGGREGGGSDNPESSH